MDIFWIVISFVILLCLDIICNEIRNVRFEIRNLKDYFGQDGINGELKKPREQLSKEK